MAASLRTNSAYITATGVVTTKRTKVKGLVFTPDANFDQMILHDGDAGGDPIILHIHGATAKETKFLDFGAFPIIFQDGIYCGTLSASASATLIIDIGDN